jgi:D-alanine-D-alanine ligase
MGRKVGVLYGGLSAERPVSLRTGAAVADALRSRGHDVALIDVGRDLPARLVAEGVEVAWLALHGRFGEDGCVQGLLEVMGIPYTGSGVRASATGMSKEATKRAVATDTRVVLAKDVVVRRGDAPPSHLRFPVVVKPNVGGSTIGMGLARDASELGAAIDNALRLDESVLVEEFVAGNEITVSILNGEPLPAVAIQPEGDGFFDYTRKYTKGRTTYTCPAPLAPEVAERAAAGAAAAYATLGCTGAARADFIVRDDGVPVFLEINTLPGMTATSLVPMAAKAAGLSFEDLCEAILRSAHRMEAEAPAPG